MKRTFDNLSYFELIKYSAFQGSSITLLGLVKYDAEKDVFQMTELSALFSGGLTKAKTILSEQLNQHRQSYMELSFVGLL